MTLYQSWLQTNISILYDLEKLKQYPALYKTLRANGYRLRRFLIALLDLLKACIDFDGTEKLPDQHGCVPVMATVEYISPMLLRAGIERELATGTAVKYNLVLLHSFHLIKRVIRPRAPGEPYSDKHPKYIYADLYTDNQLTKIEERVKRWAMVTDGRKRLSRDDVYWLYGQHDKDLIFIPDKEEKFEDSWATLQTFYQAYESARISQNNGKPVTIKQVEDKLWKPMKQAYPRPESKPLDEYNHEIYRKIQTLVREAKIPLFVEYGLQNRRLTAQERQQYGITDHVFWAIMPVPEDVLEEIRSKRTEWDTKEDEIF